MYIITLADGTKLKNLELNGNNYISKATLDDSVFKDNLSSVTISDGESSNTHTDLVLVNNQIIDGQSWFILGEKSPQELMMEALRAEIVSNEETVTELQVALAEIYELIVGGV